MLVLDLLQKGIISFNDKEWLFEIKQNENIDHSVCEIAIKDILLYADNLMILQGRNITAIEIKTKVIKEQFSAESNIKIDLNLYKKYDDSIKDVDVYYIRNDYFLYDVNANVEYQTNIPLYNKAKNYYKVENGLNKYELNKITEEKRIALKFFLNNIFHFEEFLPTHEEIIFECLRSGCIIGLLPTGAGKSLCYQLSSLLIPGTTLVVSPLKILMKDQYENLVKRHNISNICYIN